MRCEWAWCGAASRTRGARRCWEVTDEGLRAVSSQLISLRTSLDLRGCSHVTHEGQPHWAQPRRRDNARGEEKWAGVTWSAEASRRWREHSSSVGSDAVWCMACSDMDHSTAITCHRASRHA
jgi:hypothetical protein